MGPFLVVGAAAFASGLVLLAMLGRHRESAWLEDWQEILTPAGQQRCEELRARFERECAASEFTYRRARAAAAEGDDAGARRLLEADREFVASLAPDRDRLLRDLARYARMIGAGAPVPPLRPAQFQLRRLAALAALGWLAHQFLATVPERQRLRLAVLRRGQAIVLRTMPGASRSPDWERIDAARADWLTLDREALESFRSLVMALLDPAPNAGA